MNTDISQSSSAPVTHYNYEEINQSDNSIKNNISNDMKVDKNKEFYVWSNNDQESYNIQNNLNNQTFDYDENVQNDNSYTDNSYSDTSSVAYDSNQLAYSDNSVSNSNYADYSYEDMSFTDYSFSDSSYTDDSSNDFSYQD